MKLIFKSGKQNLVFLLLLTFVLIYITNHFILTPQFFESSSDPLGGTPEEGLKIYQNLQRWIFVSTAIYLLIKIFLITLVVYTALYLHDYEVPFKDLFNITTQAEFIFLIPAIIKVITFSAYFPQGNLTDWHRYYILSALSLFKEAPADWNYALQTMNIFEVCYWFFLAFGIHKISKLSFDRSLQIVLVSYLPALMIWVATISFCTLVIFPNYG